MKTITVLFFLFLQGFMVQAQQLVLTGRIMFERKQNVLKAMDEEQGDRTDDVWYTEMRKKMPQYKTDLFQLNFSTRQTLYTTVQEDETPILRWQKTVTELTQKTIFASDSTWANRTVYDKTYVVADSIMKPEWKLTGEYREIAGYTCRRAVTILYDSVYVIAFYTDAIPVGGGPDLFAGLPGMILGVVIPRLHITLFATRVEPAALTENDFAYRTKRKSIFLNREAYRMDLSENTERWGSYGTRFVLKALF